MDDEATLDAEPVPTLEHHRHGGQLVMVDDALHRKVVTRAELDLQIERSVRRHGRARAIRAFAFADGLCESVGESRSRVGMHLAGIPAPELQAEIRHADGSLVARVDFRWGR